MLLEMSNTMTRAVAADEIDIVIEMICRKLRALRH